MSSILVQSRDYNMREVAMSMFVRPGGLGFSDSFTALDIKNRADRDGIERKKAKMREKSRTTLSEIDELAKSCSTTQDKEFLVELKKVCLSIFQTIKEFPTNSSAIELKSQINSLTAHTFEKLKYFVTDDEDIQVELIHTVKPLLQKEVNYHYDCFLQAQTPPDDPAFYEFLDMRKDSKVKLAKEEALNKIKILLSEGSKFFQRNDVLLCVDIAPWERGKELDKVWVKDLADDLKVASIKANTIAEALEKSESPARLQGSYLNGSGLPKVVVVIATDSLHKAKSENSLCGQKEEMWLDAIEGIRGLQRKIIPVRLGAHQTFWPNGRYHHNDFQEPLLTQFPVPRKGYFTVLFNDIIQPLIKKEDLQRYAEIVDTFNQKIKEN
ncbi:hypothetical protein pah_c004o296 [Parachlamydia acanthamoebae str. Hall's coccus]|nr:hypothetical protein pah_c004o296 [Parachlamydia acanthamoebae str. Hall's coccus]